MNDRPPTRSLPELCLAHPAATLSIIAAITVAGAFALTRVPVSLMPDIVYPMIRVQITAGQTPPEVLVNTVTRVLEQDLSQVEGLEQMESTTEQGRVQITLSMELGRDIDAALRDAAAWVDRSKGKLPAGLDPPIIFKFDPQNLPVVEFALSSATVDPITLRDFAENNLSYRFIGTAGVSTIRVAGGKQRELQVRVNPEQLRGHGLVFEDLAQVLRADNVQQPSGRIDAAGKELFGQVLSLFHNAREIADLRVATPNGDPVRLREVADVIDTHAEQRLIVVVNGQESVKLSVFKTPEANSVAVARGVRERLLEVQNAGGIPKGVSAVVINDESIYITQSIDNARHALLLADARVAFVVLLFLSNWRFMLVSMAVLPVAMLATAALMSLSRMSLNLMSIGGLIVGVGLLVDYGIILLENIARHWTTTKDVQEAVAAASREVTAPLVASLGVLIATVAPFLLVGGLAALFFHEFILAIIFATLAGLLVALAVIPPLHSLVQGAGEGEHAEEGRIMRGFTMLYRRLLEFAIRRRHWVLAAALSVFAAAVSLVGQLGYIFLPEIDNGQVTVTSEGEPGMLLKDFGAAVQQVASLALDQDEVALVDSTIGGRIGQTIQVTPASGEMMVQLVPKSARPASVQDWIASFAAKVRSLDLPGVTVRARKARMRAIRTFTGSAATQDFDVVVIVEGQNAQTLAEIGEKVSNRLRIIPNLEDLNTTLVVNQPMVNFAVDRQRAAVYGVSPATVSDTILAAVNGAVPSRLLDNGLYYDIRLQLPREDVHDRLLGLAQLPAARLKNGDTLLVGQVAGVQFVKGPLSIDKVNQSAVNMVTASVRGRTLGEAAADVRSAFQAFSLPPGYNISYGGRMAALRSSGGGLVWVGALVLFLVFVVLVVQYESLRTPLVIMCVLPFGLVGSAAALWWFQTPLSATAIIGLVLLVGIAGNNAVVLVAFAEQLRGEGHSLREAALLASTLRFRPKLMTASVAMAAMIPIAMGTQEGGEILQPLAVVVLGGMPASLLGTLLVLPVLYVTTWRQAD